LTASTTPGAGVTDDLAPEDIGRAEDATASDRYATLTPKWPAQPSLARAARLVRTSAR